MSNGSARNPIAMLHGATFVILLRHAMLPVLWFFVTVFVMPAFADFVSDLGDDRMVLPPITQVVMNMSQFTVNHPFFVAFLIVLLLAADAGIYIFFLNTQGTATARAWAVIVILAQAVATALYVTAMLLPMVVSTAALLS